MNTITYQTAPEKPLTATNRSLNASTFAPNPYPLSDVANFVESKIQVNLNKGGSI